MAFILDGESLDWRVDINIDSANIDANLTDKDVKVDLSLFGADFWDNVKADGGDIRASLADGVTRIPVAIYNIDTGAETGYMRLKAPSIASSVDTKLFIFWGNAALSQPARATTYGADNVWDGNTVYVSDFENSPASTGTTDDITGNGHLFESHGGMVAGDLVAAINGSKGWMFSGGEIARKLNATVTDFSSDKDWTIEIHNKVNPDDATTLGRHFFLVAQIDGTGTPAPSRSLIGINFTNLVSTNNLRIDGQKLGESPTFSVTGVENTGLDWRHCAMTHTTGAPQTFALFRNGVADGSRADVNYAWDAGDTSTVYTTFAGYLNGAVIANEVVGIFDEVRFSSVVRAAAWLKATSVNLRDLSNFYSIGSYEQTIGTSSYAYTDGIVMVS